MGLRVKGGREGEREGETTGYETFALHATIFLVGYIGVCGQEEGEIECRP